MAFQTADNIVLPAVVGIILSL